MQRKRKRDKADEGKEHRSPPSAPTPNDNGIEDSDTELEQKVTRISFELIKEVLPVNDSGNSPTHV